MCYYTVQTKGCLIDISGDLFVLFFMNLLFLFQNVKYAYAIEECFLFCVDAVYEYVSFIFENPEGQ